jgi:AraC-like DNA-binding protein
VSKRIRRQRGPLEWTAERDALIRRRRAQRRSYPAIAAELGLSPSTVARHAIRELGLPAVINPAQLRAALRQAASDTDRPPLPPGDPASWGLLLSLTPSLGNLLYPPYRPLICRAGEPAVERIVETRLAA